MGCCCQQDPGFGRCWAGQFRRHLESAQDLGLEVAIYNSPGLAFDLDTPADLVELEKRSPGMLETLVQERVL